MIIDELVTDRTQEDVNEARRILNDALSLGWERLPASDKNAYLAGLRGCYNASDLNRVGAAVNYLKNMLAERGITVNVSGKTDWNYQSVPTRAVMKVYLDNVKKLADIARDIAGARAINASNHVYTGRMLMGGIMANTDATGMTVADIPEDMANTTYADWNNIEQALKDVYNILTGRR